MDDVNLMAVALAAVAQFVAGMVWYMPVFGKVWGQMHGFDKLSKKVQDEMAAKMGPWYAVQFVLVLTTSYVLARLMNVIDGAVGPYELAFWVWLGFTVPAQASAAIFGGAPEGWTWQKIGIQASGSLVAIMAAAWVLVSVV